jgi:hypothetical protein
MDEILLRHSISCRIRRLPRQCTNDGLGSTSVVDPNSYFSYSDPQIFFRIRILILIFWPEIFYMGSLVAFICELESVRRKKVFSLSSVWSAIFHNIFYFTTVPGSESETKPEFFSNSDSVAAKIFGFFWIRIRIHNIDVNTKAYRDDVSLTDGTLRA